ncbi:MAG: PRD domain-containing protein [Propioniciclava sp.]|uniref:PRD domain-containing protein n=1 Tax=Propioniciclava sp. TaxID=2038686 RepID=UPI0039E3D968
MRVTRVLNNNAAMVVGNDGATAIVLGRAIGYGKRPGDMIDPAAVSERFVPDASTSLDRLTAFLAETPLEVVRLAREIAEVAHTRLGVRISQALVLPLADHLAFAIQRSRSGSEIDYPLRWEIAQLYPQELALGREAVDLVRRRLGVELAEDEAVAVAMHVVNAQFAGASLAPTLEMTTKLNRILGVIETTMGIQIDRDAMSTTRFITHLRYLFVRLQTHQQFAGEPTGIRSAVLDAHPRAYQCAERIRYLLTLDDQSLSDDEVTYLTLHIARLMQAAQG